VCSAPELEDAPLSASCAADGKEGSAVEGCQGPCPWLSLSLPLHRRILAAALPAMSDLSLLDKSSSKEALACHRPTASAVASPLRVAADALATTAPAEDDVGTGAAVDGARTVVDGRTPPPANAVSDSTSPSAANGDDVGTPSNATGVSADGAGTPIVGTGAAVDGASTVINGPPANAVADSTSPSAANGDDDSPPSPVRGRSRRNVIFTTGGLTDDVRTFKPLLTPYKRKEMSFGTIDPRPSCNCPPDPNHWEPSSTFIGLPYIFARRNNEDRDFFSKCVTVNNVIAHELGYPTWVEYLETRGWTCQPNEGTDTYCIRFVRVQDVPAIPTARNPKHKNLHALLKALHSRVNDPAYKDIYDGQHPLKIMKFDSFVAKTNCLAQDLLKALVVTTRSFLPHVNHHFGEKRYWTETIFKGCHTRKKLRLFQSDLVLLLNSDGGSCDGAIQKDLLCNYVESMYAQVEKQARGIRFNEAMRGLAHRQLASEVADNSQDGRRECVANTKWAVVKNRILDDAIPILEKDNPKRGTLSSLTYHRKKRKPGSVADGSSSKKGRVGGCLFSRSRRFLLLTENPTLPFVGASLFSSVGRVACECTSSDDPWTVCDGVDSVSREGED